MASQSGSSGGICRNDSVTGTGGDEGSAINNVVPFRTVIFTGYFKVSNVRVARNPQLLTIFLMKKITYTIYNLINAQTKSYMRQIDKEKSQDDPTHLL